MVGHFSLAAEWLVIFHGGRVIGHFLWQSTGWSLSLVAEWLVSFLDGQVVGHFIYWRPSGWSLSFDSGYRTREDKSNKMGKLNISIDH